MRGSLSVWQGPDQAEHDREEAEAVEEAEADHHGEHLSEGKFKYKIYFLWEFVCISR